MLVECVPNFSEGRRISLVDSIADSIESVDGVWLLDRHSSWAHNRSVITFAGGREAVAEAAFRGAQRAARLINMRQHQGSHPRMGATDVVPFVPLGETPMAVCIELANEVGQRIGSELGIPVYLYAEAARAPERRWLPHVRHGEFEAISAEIGVLSERLPDFGPRQLGPAGATAVGARTVLIAFNVNLATGNLEIARTIARLVRQSSGGLPAVQARGMSTENPEVVQVSTNLLDYHVTPLHLLFERVAELAAERGVDVVDSEVVGLLPTEALTMAAGKELRIPHFGPGAVLEQRLLEAVLRGE